MTRSMIEARPFTSKEIKTWPAKAARYSNWPVVYTLDGARSVYVGESLNVANRMHQHLANPEKTRQLDTVRVVMADQFNKSACLDLESFLIRMFAGDGKYTVVNRNEGITDADYFDRSRYQEQFREIFEELREQGLFQQSIEEIEQSDLFKFSPFKSLNGDQMVAVDGILRALFDDLRLGNGGTIAIEGEPGTGKTVVAVYLLKILADIREFSATADEVAELNEESAIAHHFTEANAALLAGASKIGFVIPQQSLRDTLRKVFKKTPGLSAKMIMTPYNVGESDEDFDLLVVDEAHRLTQWASQSNGFQNKQFKDIMNRLFPGLDREELLTKTQIDWIRAKSRHQLFLLDKEQSVRPADVPAEKLDEVLETAEKQERRFQLTSQMRVAGGVDYIRHARSLLTGDLPTRSLPRFEGYDFKIFDDLGEMRRAIKQKDQQVGLSRLLAGYGFKWVSKKDPSRYDIELDGERLQWNRSDKDWVNTPGSADEVGSIHTIQGYDLNYAGVIIGPELRYDAEAERFRVDKTEYRDVKGKQDNGMRGIATSDAELLEYIQQIYAVLLSRGMRGTYVYASTPDVREYLHQVFSGSSDAEN